MDSIYTLQSFLAVWLVAAWLVVAGLVTLVVALARIAWVIRCGIALLLFAPVVLAGAFEIYWALVCAVFGGSLLIAGLHSKLDIRPAGNRTGSETVETPRLNFSIANGLFVTALCAGAIALAMHTPALNLRAWLSLLVIAVTSISISVGAYLVAQVERPTLLRIASVGIAISLVTVLVSYFDWLLLSLYIELGWPPDVTALTWGLPGVPTPQLHPEWLWFSASGVATVCLFLWSRSWLAWRSGGRGRSVTRVLTIGSLLTLLAPPLGLSLVLLHVPRLLERSQEENAYPQLAASAARVAGSTFANYDWEEIPAVELSKLILEIDKELDDLLEQLQLPIAAPIDFSIDLLPVDDVTNFRAVARAFMARARLRSGGRGAAIDCLGAVQLGVRARRGGLLVQYTAGMAFSSIGVAELYSQRTAFDDATRAMVSHELVAIANEIEPLESVLATERIWITSQGWHSHLFVLLSELSGESVVGVDVEMLQDLGKQERLLMGLLATEMALQNYHSQHGKYPDSLQRLVPELLPEVPSDLYAKGESPLSYQRRDDSYVLYSIGVDGVDDGGTITETPSGVLPSDGDLLLPGRFGSLQP